MIGRSDSTQHQNLGRIDGPGRNYDLLPRPGHVHLSVLVEILHPVRRLRPLVDQHSYHLRLHPHLQVLPGTSNRPDERRIGARPLSVPHGALDQRHSHLPAGRLVELVEADLAERVDQRKYVLVLKDVDLRRLIPEKRRLISDSRNG